MSSLNLSVLRVGDFVAKHFRCISVDLPTKHIITKVTKTQITLDDGSRWLMRGRMVGAPRWSQEWIDKWDEARHLELVRKAEALKLRLRVLHDAATASITPDQWSRIDSILKEKTE